ncbi:MAG: peptidase family protein [Ilumatobacteraceae bacterium]|nr:peptidase family protein [Ilumatobacteraceae bacterium]MCU1390143.1 peptidase family protein [Ilumatobacteraceae bacterium]
MTKPTRHRALDRSVERSAVAALLPVLALVPVWLLSLAVFWLPIRAFWQVPFWLFAVGHLALVVVMFWRPLQTVLVMRMLGASRATHDEASRLEPAWRSVAQQLGIRPRRYALAVLPSDELNAFACGGSLLVVTSYAIETLPRDEMTGVLAHELAHHLGFHTVALTLRQWLSLPIFVLARIGFFLQNVAAAATSAFVSHSTALSAVGRLISGLLNAVAWVFLSALLVSNRIAGRVERGSEFEADRRAVEMGFGRELATALRRVDAAHLGDDAIALPAWARGLVVTHPSARSRVVRIDALVRRQASRERLAN